VLYFNEADIDKLTSIHTLSYNNFFSAYYDKYFFIKKEHLLYSFMILTYKKICKFMIVFLHQIVSIPVVLLIESVQGIVYHHTLLGRKLLLKF